MKGLKISIKDDYASGFIKMVDTMMNSNYTDDDDKLIMAALAEIKHRLAVKQLKPQTQYTITLTPVQALAVRLLYTGYVNENDTLLGTYLQKISNQVGEQFKTKPCPSS